MAEGMERWLDSAAGRLLGRSSLHSYRQDWQKRLYILAGFVDYPIATNGPKRPMNLENPDSLIRAPLRSAKVSGEQLVPFVARLN